MSRGKSKKSDGILRGVALAHLILALHVLLIAAIGLIVLFFRGVVLYLPWIFLGGIVFIMVAGFLFYRRLKSQGRSLRETLNTPLLRGQSVEVSLLGGLASIRIGKSSNTQVLEDGATGALKQLQEPISGPVRELTELAHLLESGLITRAEYEQTKKTLLDSVQVAQTVSKY